MNSEQHTILALMAMGRVTPSQAERLLAAVNETREMVWILALCLAGACVTQLPQHELLPRLLHFFHAQVPVLAEAVLHALSPLTRFLGGSL